jgi:hypothetical protein
MTEDMAASDRLLHLTGRVLSAAISPSTTPQCRRRDNHRHPRRSNRIGHSEESAMAHPGQVIASPITGEQITFRTTAADSRPAGPDRPAGPPHMASPPPSTSTSTRRNASRSARACCGFAPARSNGSSAQASASLSGWYPASVGQPRRQRRRCADGFTPALDTETFFETLFGLPVTARPARGSPACCRSP